tara:strand:+ start:1511 stop:1792 length:282 start_codon:yes stop_codon:yes gene_type:complete
MITKRERNKIKKILGGHYTDAVLEVLNNKGVRNKYGLFHSATMVQTVMNGQPHREIEEAIWDAVENRNKIENDITERKNRLLEQTKTGAATPV